MTSEPHGLFISQAFRYANDHPGPSIIYTPSHPIEFVVNEEGYVSVRNAGDAVTIELLSSNIWEVSWPTTTDFMRHAFELGRAGVDPATFGDAVAASLLFRRPA